ncbi:MAG: glycosyl hydrolase 53 family protein [Bacteroidales bacterium]
MKTILESYLLLENSLSLNTEEECHLCFRQICTPHFKYIGGDLSLLLRYKELDAVYTNEDNQSIPDLFHYYGENGFNTIRCRLLVNPDSASFACQDLDYVIRLAKEIKASGFEFYLTIHYSDQYADSQLQEKPSQWTELNREELRKKIYTYTCDVLNILKDNSVVPDLIQIGNGLQNGFLWEDGFLHEDYPSNNAEWFNFLSLLKSASRAIRDTLSGNINIVIGIDSLRDKERAFEFFSRLMIGNIDFDTIGLTYRSYSDGSIPELIDFIDNLLYLNGAKDILFTEISIPYDQEGVPEQYRDHVDFEISPSGQKIILYNLIREIAYIPQVSGIIYWYAEETMTKQSNPFKPFYAGLFNNKSGQVMPAFSIFRLINRKCR